MSASRRATPFTSGKSSGGRETSARTAISKAEAVRSLHAHLVPVVVGNGACEDPQAVAPADRDVGRTVEMRIAVELLGRFDVDVLDRLPGAVAVPFGTVDAQQ